MEIGTKCNRSYHNSPRGRENIHQLELLYTTVSTSTVQCSSQLCNKLHKSGWKSGQRNCCQLFSNGGTFIIWCSIFNANVFVTHIQSIICRKRMHIVGSFSVSDKRCYARRHPNPSTAVSHLSRMSNRAPETFKIAQTPRRSAAVEAMVLGYLQADPEHIDTLKRKRGQKKKVYCTWSCSEKTISRRQRNSKHTRSDQEIKHGLSWSDTRTEEQVYL